MCASEKDAEEMLVCIVHKPYDNKLILNVGSGLEEEFHKNFTQQVFLVIFFNIFLSCPYCAFHYSQG